MLNFLLAALAGNDIKQAGWPCAALLLQKYYGTVSVNSAFALLVQKGWRLLGERRRADGRMAMHMIMQLCF